MFTFETNNNDIIQIAYKSHIAGRDVYAYSDPLNILQTIEQAICISGYPSDKIPKLMIDINVQFMAALDNLTIY
jgi:hypothetical protein